MKLLNFGAIALAFCLGGAAQASTITLETFTTAGWLSAAQGGVFEDFEDQTDDTFGVRNDARRSGYSRIR